MQTDGGHRVSNLKTHDCSPQQIPQLESGESRASSDAPFGQNGVRQQPFTGDVPWPSVRNDASKHFGKRIAIDFGFFEQEPSLNMLKSFPNIEKKLNKFSSSAGDGSNLHPPSRVTHPSAGRVVALGIGQFGSPLLDYESPTLSIDSENGSK